MIIYNPLDGDAITSRITSKPRHCFLITRLGRPIPAGVQAIRSEVKAVCTRHYYNIMDANSRVTGRDVLLKIWTQIASAPLAIAVVHEDIPAISQQNIYYELGVAQADDVT